MPTPVPLTKSARLKKSETLEIRLPYATKQAFMADCQASGRTASEALRGYIDTRLSAEPRARRRNPLGRLVAGFAIVTAVGAFALPSLARTSLEAQVGRLDRDADGAVSLAEFARLDADHDGKVSLAELRGR